MKVMPNKLRLRPSVSAVRGIIAIPEAMRRSSSSCMIMDVGKGCHHSLKVGRFALCNTIFSERNNHLNETRDFICIESQVFGVVINSMIMPLGSKVLVERDMSEVKKNGLVVMPEAQQGTDQSLRAKIIRFGIPRIGERFKVEGISIGDKVVMSEWNEAMVEVDLPGHKYGLIVDEKFLLYKTL